MANQINYVAQQLGKRDGPYTIPADANFIVSFIDGIPNVLPRVAGTDGFQNIEPQRWNDNKFKTYNALDFAEETQKLEIGVLYASQVTIPGETLGFSRDAIPGAGAADTGTLLGAPLLKSRTNTNTIKISFIETDSSFPDFVIRPWILIVGTYGLFARPQVEGQRHSQDVKRNLQITWLDYKQKTRKKFNFYDCVPTSIESSSYAYEENSTVKKFTTEWIYTNYTVNSDD